MTEIILRVFFSGLAAIFLCGCLFIFPALKSLRVPQSLFKLLLLAIFFSPFIFYLVAAFLGIKFGNPRNFFYLLPVYFLVVFSGLKKLLPAKNIFYFSGTFILILLLFSGFSSSNKFWQKAYLERAMLRQAAETGSGARVISYTQRTVWPFYYYVQKYGLPQRTFPWDSGRNPEMNLDFLARDKDLRGFTVIGDKGLSLKDGYSLGTKLFKLKETIFLQANFGPSWLWGYSSDHPVNAIKIMIFNES